jgi:hypothetical protein
MEFCECLMAVCRIIRISPSEFERRRAASERFSTEPEACQGSRLSAQHGNDVIGSLQTVSDFLRPRVPRQCFSQSTELERKLAAIAAVDREPARARPADQKPVRLSQRCFGSVEAPVQDQLLAECTQRGAEELRKTCLAREV